LQQKGDGFDRYILAVRQMNSFESCMSLDKGIHGFIGKIDDL
jgi:hypothetical protein